MIQVFFNEFLQSPAPLEYSGTSCNHACCYCFANIRCRRRPSKIKSALAQIKYMDVRDTLTHILLREGYPICISNRTDPFSKSNYIETISLVQNLQLLPNRIFFQTKGIHGIDDVLDILGEKKSVFYITTSFLNDSTRKIVEPNATSVDDRLKLAEKLKKRGHCVLAALNPYVPEWISDKEVEELGKILLRLDIKSIALEPLHMNKNDIQKLFPKEIEAFKTTNVNLHEYAILRHPNRMKRVADVFYILEKMGMYPFKLGIPKPTKFYDEINITLGKFFPNAYMLINYAAEKFGQKEGILTLEDYLTALSNGNEIFFNRELKMCDKYIITSNLRAWANNPEAQGVKTIKDVLRIFWNNRYIKQSPQHNVLFLPIGNDKMGNLLLKYDGGKLQIDDKRAKYIGTYFQS